MGQANGIIALMGMDRLIFPFTISVAPHLKQVVMETANVRVEAGRAECVLLEMKTKPRRRLQQAC
jgi:hypothetical protein